VAISDALFRAQILHTQTSKRGEKRRIFGYEKVCTSQCKPLKNIEIMQQNQAHKFCIAPMMDWNDFSFISTTSQAACAKRVQRESANRNN
jgi:hypothetical protein